MNSYLTKRKFTRLEFILLFITVLLVTFTITLMINSAEQTEYLAGAMAHYGHALDKLIEYEPENEYWQEQLDAVKKWFEMSTMKSVKIIGDI